MIAKETLSELARAAYGDAKVREGSGYIEVETVDEWDLHIFISGGNKSQRRRAMQAALTEMCTRLKRAAS